MAGYFGVPRKVKKELADECGGRKTAAYKASLAFFEEINPPRFSRAALFGSYPFISRFLSGTEIIGGLFEPPNPFGKLSKDVNLSAVFSHSTVPNHAQAQAMFNRLDLDKSNHKIGLNTYKSLRHVADTRVLNDGMLRKAFVVSNEVRNNKGEAININPYSKRKISFQRISGGAEKSLDKFERLLKEFDPKEQTILLKRCDFSKTKLNRDSFIKLEKMANQQGLNLFDDLKVKPAKIQTVKIDTAKMSKLLVEAVRNNQPLDLRCMDIRKCDMQEAFKAAAVKLASENKKIHDLKLDSSKMAGAKMDNQQHSLLNVLTTSNNPHREILSAKTNVIKTPLKTTVIAGVETIMATSRSIKENITNGIETVSNWVGKVRAETLAAQQQMISKKPESWTQSVTENSAGVGAPVRSS